MKKIAKHVQRKLTKLPRKYQHPLVHHVHKKHRISRRTLFYMKEYGPHSHIASVIIRESIKIIILTSLISSSGGIALQSVEEKIIAIAPLIILMPALNNLVGSFGTLISSKFTTLLYTGRVSFAKSKEHLISLMFMIAFVSSIYLGIASVLLGTFYGYPFSYTILIEIVGIAVLATLLLVGFISIISIALGFYIFKRNEDPNNFLIPISTSIADVGSMTILAVMVTLLF